MKTILCSLLLIPSLCFGQGNWNDSDTIAYGSWAMLHAMDYNQTNRISESCHKGKKYGKYYYEEANPLLGRCPSKVTVRNFFLVTSGVYAGITYYMPRRYKPLWHGVSIIMKAATVARNKRLGLSFAF